MSMAEKLEAGEVYRGPCGILKDSQWLSAETIPADRDTILTIEKVVRRKSVKFKSETKNGYGSLKFVGKERELGLNATNIRALWHRYVQVVRPDHRALRGPGRVGVRPNRLSRADSSEEGRPEREDHSHIHAGR
jgi:hypothetical protein